VADTIAGLSGTQRNARDALVALLKLYDVESLADNVLHYIQEGFSADTIMLELQQTKEWKARFAGNEIRAKKGYDVISPADYINTERSYRQILRSEGFPPGFYDQPADFAKAIGNDMSAAELVRRVSARKVVFDSTHTGAAEWFKARYGVDREGSFAAFIDPDRALPLLEKQAAAAAIGAGADYTGFGPIHTSTAERLAERGITEQQALQGFGDIAGLRILEHNLPGQVGQTVTAEDLVASEFENDWNATQLLERVKGARVSDFGEGAGGFAQTKEGVSGLRTAGQ
jgi:hypothetical protein